MALRLTFDTLDEALEQITIDVRRYCITDVSEGTGLAPSTIRRWQQGGPHRAPRLISFIKLCDYFGYNVQMHVVAQLVAVEKGTG